MTPASKAADTSLGTEIGHTYQSWRIDRSLKILWLDEPAFLEMPRARRATLVRAQVVHRRGAVPSVRRWSDVIDAETLRSQADGHRFVWWPSLVALDPHGVLSRVVGAAPEGAATEAHASRHADVARKTWVRCAQVLPDAERIAGTFAPSTAANCFATVMAAAGVAGAEDACMLQVPFLQWLAGACRRSNGGSDDEPGTVLVWRNSSGDPVHAAVTIGDGWTLEKASGEWWTPRATRSTKDVIRAARAPGQRLERHRITA